MPGLPVGDNGRVGRFFRDEGGGRMVSVGKWVLKGSVKDDTGSQ